MSEPIRRLYLFGPFRLDGQKRLLWREDAPVKLAPKVFETLLALVEGRGQLLEKDELMKRLWPDRFVEEGNLALNISTLRKALGETPDSHRYIVTAPGQGYRFVADVEEVSEEALVREHRVGDARLDLSEGAPATASELQAAELEAHPKPSVPPVVPQTDRTLRRGRVGLVVALSALLVTVISGTVGLFLSQRDRRQIHAAAPRLDPQVVLRRFTTHGGVPMRVAISPDGQALVYQQRLNGRDSLWLGQIATNTSVLISGRTDLTYGEVAFAPDGSSIYFTVTGSEYPEGMLMRMPVLGGVMTELIANVDSPVAVSPDGAQVAFLRVDDRTRQSSVVLAATAAPAGQRTLVTRQWPEAFSQWGLAWSPDGTMVAVGARRADGREEVAAVRIDDGRVTRIGNRDWGRVGNLVWLRDDSGLVLVGRDRAAERRAYLWFVPHPDGEARKVSEDVNLYLTNSLSVSADGRLAVLQGYVHSAIWVAAAADVKGARLVLQGVAPRYEGVDGLAWTADRRLLYTAYSGNSLGIWSMNAAGGDLRPLTVSSSGSEDSRVCATRDGRYIVFQSNRSGSLEIWRANADGSGLMQLTRGGDNTLPSLSPDSRYVIYVSTKEGTSTLWRTSIDGAHTDQLTETPSSSPQVSPSGTQIAYTVPGDAPDARLTIMPFEGGPPMQAFAVPATGLRGRRVMRWTPDGSALVYRDGLAGLWRQPLAEERARPVPGFEELVVRHFDWSFDGKSLAYTTGPTTQEIILIDHVK